MMLSELNIDEDAFDIFVTFNAMEKIEFLSDAMEFGAEAAMLKRIDEMTISDIEQESIPIISSQDFISNGHRLCVTTTEGEVQLNSNSLKTIRGFVLKLTMDGLIVLPLNKKKSSMVMYRYFKAYSIIGRSSPISLT